VKINCSDFVAEIGNLLDGEVSAEVRAHLEQHLAECKACTAVYDSTRKTLRIVSDSGSFELPKQFLKADAAAIMARIRARAK
jgi:anti-sigma factor RsiW